MKSYFWDPSEIDDSSGDKKTYPIEQIQSFLYSRKIQYLFEGRTMSEEEEATILEMSDVYAEKKSLSEAVVEVSKSTTHKV